MKKIIVTLLAFCSVSAFAEEFCGTVGKVNTAIKIAGDGAYYSSTSAFVGEKELKDIGADELALLLSAKSGKNEVCVKTNVNSLRAIEVK